MAKKSTFELVSPFLSIYAPSRTFSGVSSLLDGKTNNALVPGELLSLDANYGVNRVVPTKLSDGTADQAMYSLSPAFAFFSETGRGDLTTGGKVPVLQFGPYEADTQVFARLEDGTLVGADGTSALTTTSIGAPVGVMGVRHPSKYASAAVGKVAGNAHADSSLVIAGLGVLSNTQVKDGAHVVGYISRITGTGANMKVRVLFGL
jgi:hypothetical protein